MKQRNAITLTIVISFSNIYMCKVSASTCRIDTSMISDMASSSQQWSSAMLSGLALMISLCFSAISSTKSFPDCRGLSPSPGILAKDSTAGEINRVYIVLLLGYATKALDDVTPYYNQRSSEVLAVTIVISLQRRSLYGDVAQGDRQLYS